VKRLKAAVLSGALLFGLGTPATAQFFGTMPVIDVASITKIVTEIQQTINLVNLAKQNLQALPVGVGLTNVQSRISAVTGMLQQAQSLCQGALSGKNLPSACQVQANTANAQAASFAQDTADLASLQAVARGAAGNLQAQQANALATLAVAQQILQQRQAQIAADKQKQIDANALKNALTGNSAGDPYGSGGSIVPAPAPSSASYESDPAPASTPSTVAVANEPISVSTFALITPAPGWDTIPTNPPIPVLVNQTNAPVGVGSMSAPVGASTVAPVVGSTETASPNYLRGPPSSTVGTPAAPIVSTGAHLLNGCQDFPSTDVNNVSNYGAPVASNSGALINAAAQRYSGGLGLTTPYQYEVVPANTPLVQVSPKASYHTIAPFPIPANGASIPITGDGNMLLQQGCTVYEGYSFSENGGSWSGYSGQGVSLSQNMPSGTCSGAGGLCGENFGEDLTYAEATSGLPIDHVLHLEIPFVVSCDGNPVANCIPLNAIIRLSPNYPLPSDPQAAAVIEALKVYGGATSDNGGGFNVYSLEQVGQGAFPSSIPQALGQLKWSDFSVVQS
jgi:hypothetical protein